MTREAFIVYRASQDLEFERPSRCSDWLSRFADEYEQSEQKQKTAVEVARERTDITEKIHAIVNGKGKITPYSSVEEAVKDYQKRTGLAEHQKRALAAQIMAAAEESIDSDEKKNLSVRPELFERHPLIDNYVRNVIDTQHGIQIPAILQGIEENFRAREGVTYSDLDSKDIIKYINDLVSARQRAHPEPVETMLGRGVGTEKETLDYNDPNRNPFAGLTPQRSMF